MPGFGARLEPRRLDVWPGDNKVVLDAAQCEGGHRHPFSRLALSPADSFCLRASRSMPRNDALYRTNGPWPKVLASILRCSRRESSDVVSQPMQLYCLMSKCRSFMLSFRQVQIT